MPFGAHTDVLEVGAIGVPDDYYGEIIRAYVVLRDGAEITPDELIAHCAGNLAKYKVPRDVAIVEAIPKTTVGKIDKKALRT